MTVIKNKAKGTYTDAMQAAGARAEEQMAFYLARHFKDRKDVLVFNDVRITDGGDTAQMDHLVLHQSGLIVIESKSVTTKVKVNRHGEWMRLWNNHWQGMASPALQAQRQIAFLRAFLQARRELLRGRKMVVVQMGFSNFDMQGLVAISDSGMIDRADPSLVPEVFKADQIPDMIEAIIATQRKASGMGSLLFGKTDDFRARLTEEELDRVLNLLLAADLASKEKPPVRRTTPPAPASSDKKPKQPAPEKTTRTAPEPHPEPAPKPTVAISSATIGTCRHCASTDGHVSYGQYGYYWKCQSCNGNTKIDKTAPDGSSGKIRKHGEQFFLTYGDGQEILLHTNTAAAPSTIAPAPKKKTSSTAKT